MPTGIGRNADERIAVALARADLMRKKPRDREYIKICYFIDEYRGSFYVRAEANCLPVTLPKNGRGRRR
jgi:hypothetical protein